MIICNYILNSFVLKKKLNIYDVKYKNKNFTHYFDK